MKILIVEDEKDLAESIATYLTDNGYICDTGLTFDEANQLIHLYEYNCVIVDITLPDGSGLDIIRELKKMDNPAAIVIITARDALDDKIIGLDIGADDYLTKPFHLAELNARIRAVIRGRQYNGKNEVVFNEIKINPAAHDVFVGKNRLELTRKEFGLLLYLVSNLNQVVTKEMIAEHLWGSHIDLVDSFEFIYSHMKNLRKKLVEAGASDYIRTVYGIGYKMSDQ